MPGEELTLDYSWDKNMLDISQDVPCLCESEICRGFLMRAKKTKKANVLKNLALKLDEASSAAAPES